MALVHCLAPLHSFCHDVTYDCGLLHYGSKCTLKWPSFSFRCLERNRRTFGRVIGLPSCCDSLRGQKAFEHLGPLRGVNCAR
jgi:hypothetical protein